MQPRRAAFALLRRLALQEVNSTPKAFTKWNRPAARLLSYRATHPLREAFQIPRPNTDAKAQNGSSPRPSYDLTFTCKPCGERSKHNISKQGYHFGSVLVSCPGCKNRHIISDHLGIFVDKSITVEDLMRERGQLVKKGSLSEDGDLEFWEDGTTSERLDKK